MAGSIAKLVVTLGANVAGFETDMKRATRQQKARMRQMEQTASDMGKAMAVAFTAAAGAISAVVLKTTQSADQMAKMATRLGTSTEALSELSHVADLSGVKFNQLTIGMQRMTRRIAEVASLGKGTAKEALDQLGLSAEALAKLPVDKQFEAVAEELSKVESQSEKVRLAFKLFDSEGVSLIQTMGDGAAGIQAMREEAQRLGKSLSTETAQAAEAFNDNITRMKAQVEGAGIAFTSGLLPALIGTQEYFGTNATNADTFRKAGEKLGDVIQHLVRGFTMLWGLLKTLADALLGIVVVVKNAVEAILAPITAMIKGVADATKALAKGDFSAAWKAIEKVGTNAAEGLQDAMKGINDGIDTVAGSSVHFKEAMEKSASMTTTAAESADRYVPPLIDVGDELENVADAADDAATDVDDVASEMEDAASDAADFAGEVQNLIDRLFPAQAEANRFEAEVELLNQAFARGILNVVDYSLAMQKLMTDFVNAQTGAEDTAEEFDLMTTAIDEGTRILERSFQSMWEGMLDGSKSAFDGILDGFKSLLTQMIHQATTQKIMLNIQQGLAPGGPGIDWGQLGKDFGTAAAVIIGAELGGGGQWATGGAALGALIGQVVIPIPVLGAAIGSVLGGLFGGLFDSDRPVQLNASGNNSWSLLSSSDDENIINTAFGQTFLTTRRADAQAIQDVIEGIKQFDEGLADFLSSDQISKITESLKTWDTHLTGEAITLEQLLNSRFSHILTTFSQDIQDFVNRGADLEDQMSRLQIGVAAEKILAGAPDLFNGKTAADFLNVVEAFQDGGRDITEAFNMVLGLLERVTGVMFSLREFADSDLAADFDQLLATAGMSLTEALGVMTDGLSDAIANFDGSPEQLEQIGMMAMSVREGEIKLLSQIDSIQKGIAANLQGLRDLVLGAAMADFERSGQDIFREATNLLDDLANAADASEIAAIEREFNELIRSMSPEDLTRFSSDLLDLIDTFESVANERLEGMKQAVIDSAEDTRQMVDEFLTEIGDPLDIVANSSQATAESLDTIEQNLLTRDDMADQAALDRDAMATVIDDGMSQINSAVGSIGPQVSSAILGGLAGVQIVVNAGQAANDLVNE